MPIIGHAIFRGIHAHRREPDSIGNEKVANLHWCEEMRHVVTIQVDDYPIIGAEAFQYLARGE